MLFFAYSVIFSVSSVTIFFVNLSLRIAKVLQRYFHKLQKCPKTLCFQRFSGILIGSTFSKNPTAVPLAVPEKILGLTLFLDFFDRGAINQLAASASRRACRRSRVMAPKQRTPRPGPGKG